MKPALTASSRSGAVTPMLDEAPGPPARGATAIALRRFVHRPFAVSALVLLVAIFAVGMLAHAIVPTSWSMINISPGAGHQAPSWQHLFGTDALGRDMLGRTLFGVRTSEEIALAAAFIATIVGTTLGALAAYFGGWTDATLMRLGDLVTAYPAIVLALAAIVYFGTTTLRTLILIFAGYTWVSVARVVRADIAGLREQEFITAARAAGASDARILLRHALPNAAGTVIVAATSLIGQIILIDATVEFFDYGLSSAATPSLGNLVADVVKVKFGLSNEPIAAAYGWWTWFFPALVLVLILTSVNLVGDAFDDAFNPTLIRK
jgi:peptide/nickel transport system permease protein